MGEETYFISYTNRTPESIAWAEWLQWFFSNVVGGKTIMQKYDNGPGNNFRRFEHKALKKADHVVCVLTPKYLKSKNCFDEWSNAKHRIPVRCVDFEPTGLFASDVYIDLVGLDNDAARKKLLSEYKLPERPMDEPRLPYAASNGNAPEPPYPGFPKNNLPARNPYFAGREKIMSDIHSAFKNFNTVTLVGAGGFGKTQTALEYAYRHALEYKSVLYFNAESNESLQAGYRDFAIKVLGLNNALKEEFSLVRAWVENWLAENGAYLLVYDNAEGFSAPKDGKYLQEEYFPQGVAGGNIIVNTREKFGKVLGKEIDATVFDDPDALAFLKKRIEGIGDTDAATLAKELAYLPLALEQASAYIIENQYGVPAYIGLYRKTGLRIFNAGTQYDNNEKTVLNTWFVTFDKIKQDKRHEASLQLMNLCAYCAPDDIPLNMFVSGMDSLPEPLKGSLGDEHMQNALTSALSKYSIMSKRRDEKTGLTLSMHRLMQSVIRNGLVDTSWLTYCVDMVESVIHYNYNSREDFDLFRTNFPHASEIVNHVVLLAEGIKKEKIGSICCGLGFGLNKIGDYNAALEWNMKALAIYEKVLGLDHPSTATSYNNIAEVYNNQGDYKAALEWFYKALAIREKALEVGSPGTATTYDGIAVVYNNQGDYKAALEWFYKALAIREKALEVGHPDTATSYNNIAVVYCSQGDYKAALEWHYKALAIKEKVLGLEHPDTATSYNNIASVYDNQGDYKVALEWYYKALVILEKALGLEHPNTASSYSNIAVLYDNQGDYKAALEWNYKALAIREKALGVEHPDTASSYNNIASVYHNQGDYKAVLEWHYKALAIKEKVLGLNHPRTATSYSNIASVYNDQGDYKATLEWNRKALEIREKALGLDHPDTAMSYNNIAEVYGHQSDYNAVLDLYKKSYRIFKVKLGETHPNTKVVFSNMKFAYYKSQLPEPFEVWLSKQ